MSTNIFLGSIPHATQHRDLPEVPEVPPDDIAHSEDITAPIPTINISDTPASAIDPSHYLPTVTTLTCSPTFDSTHPAINISNISPNIPHDNTAHVTTLPRITPNEPTIDHPTITTQKSRHTRKSETPKNNTFFQQCRTLCQQIFFAIIQCSFALAHIIVTKISATCHNTSPLQRFFSVFYQRCQAITRRMLNNVQKLCHPNTLRIGFRRVQLFFRNYAISRWSLPHRRIFHREKSRSSVHKIPSHQKLHWRNYTQSFKKPSHKPAHNIYHTHNTRHNYALFFLIPRYIGYAVRNTRPSLTLASKILSSTLAVLLVMSFSLLWEWQQKVDSQFQSVDALDLNSTAIRNKADQEGDETYLIVGVDSRSGANGNLGAGTTADVGGARSDAILLVDIPANKKRVIAVSFPRDLQINRPDCKGWDNDTGLYLESTVPGEEKSKINAAYAYGGPKCLVSVIQNLSGLEINHFVAMDFSGFEHLVNDVGGVEICTVAPIRDGQLGTVISRSGKQIIYGKTALKYVRARKVFSEGTGDYGRIKRQQRFMSSLLRSMLSKKVLSDPKKLNQLITDFTSVAYVDNITSNSLITLAQSIRNINAGHVTMLTIPTLGTSQDGLYNEIPNVDSMNKIFDAVIDDTPLPGEPDYVEIPDIPTNDENTQPASPEVPQEYTMTNRGINTGMLIKVLAAGADPTTITNIPSKLENKGFWTQSGLRSLTHTNHTIVRYPNDGSKDLAAVIASMFPDASIQQDSSLNNNISILLGKDFDGTLGELPQYNQTITVTTLPDIKEPISDDTSIINGADDTCD